MIQDHIVAAIIAELRRQEPTDGQFFYIDASNTAAVTIDATIDVDAVAVAVLEALKP